MANYPFRINIVSADGHQTAYYTSSIVTDADTIVSSSAMLDKILLMPSASFETAASGSTHMAFGNAEYDANRRFQNYTEQPGKNNVHLSASVTGPHTGSIIFHDRESTQGGGLDYYEFYGSKVCSVLGLPEGIRIRPENFKFSDDASNTGNYLSGDLISDGLQLKEGFKMAPQARVKSNLVWDDVFGEGFIQWVSGSTRKAFMGYDDQKDLYSLAISQITGSTIKATTYTGNVTGNVTGNLTGVASNASTLNYIGDHTTVSNPAATANQLIFSGSQSENGNGGDIVFKAGNNTVGNVLGAAVKGGDIVLEPGGAAVVINNGGATVTTGSIDLKGNTIIASKNTGNQGGTNLKLGDSTSTFNNWISIRCQDGDETSSGGITFYETSGFSVNAPQYGAKIVYDEDTDFLKIGTMNNNTFKKQIQIPRGNARISILGHVLPVTDDTYDLGAASLRWDDVYATNGTIQTSDRNLKTQISGSDLGLDFINNLNPVKYQWISGSRSHYGLIAQEVSSSLAKSSISTDNFAGYVENRMFISGSVSGSEKDIRDTEGWEIENFTSIPNPELGLRYNEFISPMIKAIQELSSQVESLRTQISGSG